MTGYNLWALPQETAKRLKSEDLPPTPSCNEFLRRETSYSPWPSNLVFGMEGEVPCGQDLQRGFEAHPADGHT